MSVLESVMCESCMQEILSTDLIDEKDGMANCPICASEIKIGGNVMHGGFVDEGVLIEKLEKDWGIDYDTASVIVEENSMDQLDQNMFITKEGLICSAKDDDDLKQEMLDYLLYQDGVLADIEYVFVDGCARSIEIDLQFTEVEEEDEDQPVDAETHTNQYP